MKERIKNYEGFTLLELLVVVVIIGILAAVALPKYQFALLKTKYSTLKKSAKALYDAEQRYYLIHDSYTTDLNSLDIEISGCTIESDYDVYCGNINMLYKIQVGHGGKPVCYVLRTFDTTDNKHKLCQQETGKVEPDYCKFDSNYCYYRY